MTTAATADGVCADANGIGEIAPQMQRLFFRVERPLRLRYSPHYCMRALSATLPAWRAFMPRPLFLIFSSSKSIMPSSAVAPKPSPDACVSRSVALTAATFSSSSVCALRASSCCALKLVSCVDVLHHARRVALPPKRVDDMLGISSGRMSRPAQEEDLEVGRLERHAQTTRR